MAVLPAAIAALMFGMAGSAQAHHAMGGELPATFGQGLLSGLGHPVIGIDHLAFLIAVGVAVGIARLSLALPGVFVLASALGVAVHVQGFNLPGVELLVAASVVLAGALLAFGGAGRIGTWGWAALFAVAGLFHGYAYGESIVGAEAAPLGAYLVGLVVVQTVLATAVALVTRRLEPAVRGARIAGTAIAGVGIAILIAQAVTA
jgi:urease accessory protein